MINIIIVDDHAMVRSGLRMLLSAAPDIEVAAEASEGDEGIRMALEHQPNVVLMDLSMPHGKDGLTAATELKQQLPDVAVLILTMHDDDEYLFRAIHAGAAGYVLKSAPHEELLTAIRTVAGGDAYLYPTATKRLMNEYVEQMRRGESTDLFDGLSEREKEVLSLTAMGYANKEIAEQLVISVKTVETHKSNLMEKLGLKTRPELIKYAMKKGLLQFE
ncbi:response regulator [Paenibacillus cellulositrophicus]|uniref:DNA-binding response regulator n=3 Tax=Paenibacillus TaxID=44249 RepID=A0A1R1F3Y6_9BACL|nr:MULTISPECIES: response regulator transcription factor [Paenibacillus]MBJ9990957.1 response regulator transcription factor [Paenibacillus sp. S28]OMF58745.1 DNA-binding response regulator [Paenibacillus rhizosphaerae]OXL82551.1 DNA-binding response regulator [Paenibacillus sp. SSG-1]GIO52909.1 DNA-binding response regulator [Paenibacillus cineris]GIO61410.1 DNA-binding response regulator [Paenibacillus cineris]